MCVSAKLQCNTNLWLASNWAVHAHWRSLGWSLLMHSVPLCCSKLLSLCCITEGTKLLLDLDICLHKKMLGYKLRTFSEMLQYKPGKHLVMSVKGRVLEILGFPSLSHCGFDFYEKISGSWEKWNSISYISVTNSMTKSSPSIRKIFTYKKMTKNNFQTIKYFTMIMEEKVLWVLFLFDMLRETFYLYLSITDITYKLQCNGNIIV